MTKPDIAELLPLSPLQEGLLFHALLDDDGPDVYTVQLTFDLLGPLDEGRLARAADALLARHTSLRAGFRHERLSKPVQIVPAEVALPWRHVDLSDRPADLDALLAADRLERFELSRPPLVRFTLVRLGDDRHKLVVSLHHILIDGWSMPVLLDDLFELYTTGGHDLPAPAAYRDYLGWLAGQDRAAAVAAWHTELAGLAEATLVAGPAGTAGRSGAAAPGQRVFELPETLTTRLTALARSRGWTLNTVVQGAWAMVLGQLTGRTDVVFGNTVSGRPPELPGVEKMVGLLINTLPVRVRMDPAETVAALLDRVQDAQLRLMPHQHLPLSDVQRVAGVGELFDTLAVFENYPFDASTVEKTVADLRVTGFSGQDATHYPLSLIVTPGTRLHLRFGHRADVCDSPLVERIAARLQRVFQSFADAPDQRCGQVTLLPDAERAELLSWAGVGTPPEPGTDRTIGERFAERVAAAPDTVAVVSGDTTVTYRELDERAARLAAHLLGLGVPAGGLVALALPRSVDMIVAILAVVKAGAGYLPLDPQYPTERLAHTLADAAPHLVLSTSAIADRLTGVPVVTLDTLGELPDPGPAPAPAGHLDSTAYVIYTSGSTGRPKGVAVTHRNVSRLLRTTDRWFSFAPTDTWTLFHSYAFDFSVWEIWGALLTGGRLVVVPQGVTRDPGEFLSLLVRERVTVLNQTPSAFYELLAADREQPDLGARLALRTVIFGGEALELSRLGEWYARHDGHDTVLVNMYGITETTVHVSYLALDREMAATASGSLIGEPIPDLRMYLLDGQLRPVPAGAPAEMYIAGAGVAQGYLNNPALTAHRFVADPFQIGGRMYRSGDVARRSIDGRLEYLGRADHQVKIRGFRIETGEIESVLLGRPDVGQVAVVAREDQPGDRRLVAYVVPGTDFDEAAARRHAALHLPEHMLPSAYVTIGHLPLTINGKLDRAALPAPQRAADEGARAPRTPIEEILCGIFADLLGQANVGIDDDFFALGGHSLLATRLVSRVRAALGVELRIRTLFEEPTVARLTTRLAGADTARSAPTPQPRPEPLPLSPAQRRLWFLNRMNGPSAHTIPLVLRLTGPLDAAALDAAVTDVTSRHEVLRTVYTEVDGAPRPKLRPTGTDGLTVVDTTAEALPAQLAQAAAAPFILATDPPLRATLFRIAGTDQQVLLLALHHIAGDGWSLTPLLRDLGTAYTARTDGQAPQWPPLPLQYADYAIWQRQLLGDETDPGSVAAVQLAFWRDALAGLPEELDLPTDRPRPAQASHAGGAVDVHIGPALHRRLADVARRDQASLFMVLQATLGVLLRRLGAGTDIPIGTPVAGRTDEALDDLVGCFVNTLVLRTDVSGDPSFRALLRRVREHDLAAHAHQDVPFETVVDALKPERSLSRHPLFQVLLNLQNTAEARLELPGVTATGVDLDVRTTTFDLALDLTETRDADGLPGGLGGILQFSTDLFDHATVARIAERFLRLLHQVADDAEAHLAELDVLADPERDQLLTGWNDTTRAVPAGDLVTLFAAQVAAHPDATAVIGAEQTLTYRELDERATRLARVLAARGVGPEQIVAVRLPRTPDLLVALLAVAKAGGAYLPLDPEYPAERTAAMLQDARPVLVLDTVTLDGEAADLDDMAVSRPPADRAAYVIFTSGSTGRPKGVVVSHAALSNQLHWMAGTYPLGGSDVVLARTAVSFDAAAWELWLPLVSGAALYLAPTDVTRDPNELLGAMMRHGVTVAQFVPSLLAVLPAPPAGHRVHHIFAGGEALPAALAAQVAASWQVPVVNLYGPTETTVQVTSALAAAATHDGTVPIGRPVWNTRGYVLDDQLQPVPAGVPGELYVAGDQVARGYLEQPARTAERFVADPFDPDGGRMYRTGDRVTWTADGQLSFRGRTDDQVKVRGFRVEPGEIEAVLRRVPGVTAAAVVLRDRQLVAYVAPAATVADLRAQVEQALPGHLVPSAFVVLDALPLHPNGKLDRRALPAPQAAPATVDGAARRPGTPAEEIVAGLFAELLGRADVGVDDSFFDLGGDSILSIQLVSRARKAGLVITPRAVFQHKTVAKLAAAAGTVAGLVGKGKDTGVGPVPLTPVIHALRERGGRTDRFNQSQLLRVPAGADEARLTATVQRVLDHHDVLRMRLARSENLSEWLLEVPAAGSLPATGVLHRVDATDLSQADFDRLLHEQIGAAWERVSPEAGRMAQFVWFDAGPRRSGRLLIVLHHLVVDGVSWRIIETDLAAAWQAAGTAAPAPLQPTGTSFKRWAEHLAAAAHDPARVAELPTWQHALAQPEVLLGERPLDRTQDVMSTMRLIRQELPTALTSAVISTVPAAFRAGINDVLLTALALAVADWRRRRGDGDGHALLVDLESHGREEFTDGIDLSRTVGWFTTVYPVRLDVGALDWSHVWTGGAPVAEALQRVKDQLKALPDNGLGYGLLRYLNPVTRAALAGALPPQVGFNYLGRFTAGGAAGGDWAVAPEPSDGPLDPGTPLAHCLEINAVTEDRPDGPHLLAAWSWPDAILTEAEVRDLSDTWQRALTALTAYQGTAAVDSDLVSLSAAELEDLADLDDSDESDDTDETEEWGSWK